MSRELTYAQAIQEALAQAMEADPSVFLMGEDIGVYGGAFQVTGDLVHRFGEDRVMDAPISELGQAGVAVGAALAGCKPVLEFQFSDFATLAMEQIVNQAAKLRFMLGGKVSVPLVMRLPSGSGTGAAAQHSQSLEAWLAHVPGLKVVQPSTPHEAKGLLLAAIDDPDPVMVFEHKLLYKMKGEVPEDAYRVPIGKAAVRREGRHVVDEQARDDDAHARRDRRDAGLRHRPVQERQARDVAQRHLAVHGSQRDRRGLRHRRRAR